MHCVTDDPGQYEAGAHYRHLSRHLRLNCSRQQEERGRTRRRTVSTPKRRGYQGTQQQLWKIHRPAQSMNGGCLTCQVKDAMERRLVQAGENSGVRHLHDQTFSGEHPSNQATSRVYIEIPFCHAGCYASRHATCKHVKQPCHDL